MGMSPLGSTPSTPSSPSPEDTSAAPVPSRIRRIARAVQTSLAALGQWFSRPSANQVNDSLQTAPDGLRSSPIPSDLDEEDPEISRALSADPLTSSPTGNGRLSSASTTPAGSRSSSATPSVSSTDEDALEAAKKARKEDEIRTLSTIRNVQMTFTMEVNGKKVDITPDILKQLQPIFEELAKMQEGEKLSKGFALVIDLDKLSNIRIYQNGKEILGDTCLTFFQNHPDLLANMKHIKAAIEMSQHLNLPSSTKKKPKASLALKATPSADADADYIHKVKANGDCLLESALFHIKKQDGDKANLTAIDIRKAMVEKIRVQDSLSFRDKALIFQDILDARNFAKAKHIDTDTPHSFLFSKEPNGGLDFLCNLGNIQMDRTRQQWEILLTAYANHISYNIDSLGTRPSLGGYATEYLNQNYFQEKPLLVVRKNSDNDSFEGNRAVPDNDQANTPVILYDGNHYDAIDNSKANFWGKYKSTQQSD